MSGAASRRAVLFGAGAVGAAGVLAACGADEAVLPPAVTPPPPVSQATGPGPATPEGIPVDQVPVGGGVIDNGRRVVVTQPEAGQFRAFDPTCTHESCLVTSVRNGLIECSCHGSQFRIADGSVARGPANRALSQRTATVQDGVVVIS